MHDSERVSTLLRKLLFKMLFLRHGPACLTSGFSNKNNNITHAEYMYLGKGHVVEKVDET